MALGATRPQIADLVIRETLTMLAIGFGIGIPAGMAAARFINSELYGLQSSDPITLLAVIAIMAFSVLLGSFLPARRASRVEPMAALRTE